LSSKYYFFYTDITFKDAKVDNKDGLNNFEKREGLHGLTYDFDSPGGQ